MYEIGRTALWRLLERVVGTRRTWRLFATIQVDPRISRVDGPEVSRGELAQALMMLLFEDMLRSLPANALAYLRETVRSGAKVTIDHSALRTARGSGERFPRGEDSFSRILVPLGYQRGESYPLPSRLVGHRYTHAEYPETIPQLFVSELELAAFSPASQQAMRRVLASSMDPLPSPIVWGVGDMVHLKTLISARLRAPIGVVDALKALHPTPAVGGVPVREASGWIVANESFDRGWYTGCVGWLDQKEDGTFVVAIRSGLLVGTEALVFAGAGVVAASDPFKEYEETALKQVPILRALNIEPGSNDHTSPPRQLSRSISALELKG